MDWIGKEFLLAVCASLFIVLVALVVMPLGQSPPPQAAESPQRTEQPDQKGGTFDYARLRSYVEAAANYCTGERPNPASEWNKKFICESKITDAVIAILTFFLMIFTGLLVWVGNKQEKTTRRQLRAFVYLHSGSVYNIASPLAPIAIYKPTGAEIVSPTEGPLAQLTIKNSGSTPAFDVIHLGNIHIGEFPLKAPLPPLQKIRNPPTSAIPPDGINTKSVRIFQPLTSEQVAGLRNGTTAIWVYGEIYYRDAFRRKRTSRYRLFHNNSTGAIGVSTDLTWAEGGNDAN